MYEQTSHTMELARSYASGAQEWYCPTCGRRMIMQWPPKYKKIVLELGDEQAAHAGGTGGLQIGAAQIAPAADLLSSSESPLAADAADDTVPDDGPNHEALGPWLKWLNDADLDEAA